VNSVTFLVNGYEELSSPLEAVLNMRNSAASFRNDERLALLSQHYNDIRLRPLLEQLSPQQIKALADHFGLHDPRELRLGSHPVEAGDRASLAQLPATSGMRLFSDQELDDLIPKYLDPQVNSGRGLYFTTATLTCPCEASLSWYLTQDEREKVQRAAQEDCIGKTVKDLVEWWRALPLEVIEHQG
jgi:hypothetical protein